ncbi:hypothetical protein Acr_06g0008490 [Actinidia rufa]|uniref:Uncharacterized protein n=1 Tax=Actinidia rufa TaxID=165716 RepID=A0A7J0ESE0_9ERIC|nr:hypothetical protein Acr_06g0008490 [Actinidia rufa]
MVRTKHASNYLRGDDPNPADLEMIFKPQLFKTLEVQRTWHIEFMDRQIITRPKSIHKQRVFNNHVKRGISIDSTKDEDEEDEGDEGMSRRAMEVEENPEIPPPTQWQDEETMHEEVPLQRESPMHEEAPM